MNQNFQQNKQEPQNPVVAQEQAKPIQSSQDQVSQQFFQTFEKLQKQTLEKKIEEQQENEQKQLDQLLTNKNQQQKSLNKFPEEQKVPENQESNINLNINSEAKIEEHHEQQMSNSDWGGNSESQQKNNQRFNINSLNSENREQNDINNFTEFNQNSNSDREQNSEQESGSDSEANSNIYNNGQARKRYPNSSQFFAKPNQSSFYDTPYKNSDGKQFDEQYKRNFAHMLLEKTRGLEKHIAGQLISREADKIKVYGNQVLIWMSIYRIVFAIQAQKARRKLTDGEVIAQVETRLIDYLNHNPNQKKYKFIKICNRTFRALRIKKCTGDYWLRQMFNKYEHKLNPRIDTGFLLKRLNKNGIGGSQIGGFDEDFPVQNNRSGHYLQLKCQNIENSNRGWFPIQVKQKVIKKIDKSIENAISKIFQQKINEFCVSSAQLKKWYLKFGRLQIFNPNSNSYQQQVITSNRSMSQAPRSFNMLNQGFFNQARRAQRQVLNFIRMNPSSTKSRVYSFAANVVQRLGVQQLSNQSNFTSWFNHILANYCVIFNQYVQLRNNNPKPFEKGQFSNSNFQIPIGTPQVRISTIDSQVYHPQKRSIL